MGSKIFFGKFGSETGIGIAKNVFFLAKICISKSFFFGKNVSINWDRNLKEFFFGNNLLSKSTKWDMNRKQLFFSGKNLVSNCERGEVSASEVVVALVVVGGESLSPFCPCKNT